MKARIKSIRKALKLTQTEFGERIGLKGNTITGYENGLRTPSESIVLSICREFNVDEEWLRTGEGDMFVQLPEEDEYFKAATMISKENDKEAMNAVIKYWKLDSASKKAIWNFIHKLTEK